MMYQKIKILALLFVIVSCETKQEKLTYMITKDSIQYYDVFDYSSPEDIRPTNYTFSFDVKGKFEKYTHKRNSVEEHILPYFNEPNEFGITDNWVIVNDSIIKLSGFLDYRVSQIDNDTLLLLYKNGKGNLLVRNNHVIISKESLKEKDSLYKEFKKLEKLNENAETTTVEVK